jgi:hypothetical protein
MGIETNSVELEKFDLIKDFELARANLENRMDRMEENQDKENLIALPLEEMKYLEWKSDSSDEEGFKVVSGRRRGKKAGKQKKYDNKEAKGRSAHPSYESNPFLKEGNLEIVLSLTSKKELPGIKLPNERCYLEL